ncbi:hypothetical protein G3O08_01065 [Cryomorpha ignava]|uniref:Phosphatase PAP2 family protein n=1 Tax=Cryomorpha ignava TaxID=101383 RepID=A0A7K3WKB5_9FLAO|nr:hypothetical protein [Cryomorpha ignava]NEN22093.1 hypothetical protein [Cryomorpha ignava]
MRKIAHLISAILHPLFMPLACVFVAYTFDWYINGSLSADQMQIIYLIVAFSTIVFPAVNILLLKWYGVVRTLKMESRAERNAPFISTVFFYGLGYYMLRKGALPESLFSILVGYIAVLLLIIIINFRWKISAHAAGIFGLIGAVVALFQVHSFGNIVLLSILLLLGGLVITSRLILAAHTPSESYSGAAVGFLTMYFCVYFGIFI